MTNAPDVAVPPTTAHAGRWARFRDNVVTEAREIFGLFRRSPEWAVIVFAWFAAAFIPAFWYMGEDHWWSQPSSPLFFEPFVPFFCAALLWQDRARLSEAWQMTPRNKRRGSPWLLYLGFLLVLVSHLVHVLTVAAIGLIAVAAGIIYYGYGALVLKASRRALLFALLFAPPPVKPLSMTAGFFSNSAWTKITSGLRRLGQDISCTVELDFAALVVKGHVINAPNIHLSAILVSGFFMLFLEVWRRDRAGTVLVSTVFASLLGGILSMAIPFFALLLPPSPFSETLVSTHPLIIVAASVSLAVLVRNRLSFWLAAAATRSRFLGRISSGMQKFTDRATAGVASGVGGKVGRAGQGATKGTEAAIDKFFAAISKPFKRKRRNRW